jgi:hypothetical protein
MGSVAWLRTRRAQIAKVKVESSAGFEAMDRGSLGGATLVSLDIALAVLCHPVQEST